MRVVYMGTPDFAVEPLEAIVKAGHEVVGVFTQPDKKRGRKQELTPPQVKLCAEKLSLPVFQPVTLRNDEALLLIKSLSPDVIVVAAYGKILPKAILEYPRYGCINIHASLLPKYRGAAPIQWAVLNGEEETGVTIMQMDEGIDTGDILFQRSVAITKEDTSLSMFEKLSTLGAMMIVEALEKLTLGELTAVKQEESLASFTTMIKKEMALIDWTLPCDKVLNLIRGMFDWPIAYTKLNGKTLKIYRASLSSLSGEAGEVVSLSPLVIACQSGAVEIRELQLEGKKRLEPKAFLMGYKLQVGDRLGE